MDLNSEIQRIVNQSILFLEQNPEFKDVIENWINHGSKIYERLLAYNNRQIPTYRKPFYDRDAAIVNKLLNLLEESNIVTERDLIFRRETSYPVRPKIRNVYVPFSVTSRTDESPGCYRIEVYEVIVPAGTSIFFISALDILDNQLPYDETEEEFIVAGETTLFGKNTILLNETN